MKKLTERILHYATLAAVTIVAVWVMWRMSARGGVARLPSASDVRPLPPVSAPKSLVSIAPIRAELCEITSTFSGKIRAWETYQVGFEVGGRVVQLGVNAVGQPLDDGDRVDEGQILAVLDDRALRARRTEASVQVEQAASDLERAQMSRRGSPNAMSESELQQVATNLALARAQFDVANKNLEDATLRAPVAATISRRMIKPGETIGAHQVVFELVQNDKVLLVLNVPESQVRELEARLREVRRDDREPGRTTHPDNRVFRAHVQPEGKDVFGNPWPVIDGEVYQIAEVSDATTSLFEVEVQLPNSDRLLRPGMVATARLVVDQVFGYKVPSIAVIFRQNRAHLFTIDAESTAMEVLYWQVGEAAVNRARKIDLTQWADQGPFVIVPADLAELDSVITRGQYRLADGQFVRIVDDVEPASDGAAEIATASRPEADQ